MTVLTPAAATAALLGTAHFSQRSLESSAEAAEQADPTTSEQTLSSLQWERLSGQRDVMIKAMVSVFTRLNGGVFAFTFVAWCAGLVVPDYRIVDGTTLMALIGATVVQAGIAFVAITRFLFPGRSSDAH